MPFVSVKGDGARPFFLTGFAEVKKVLEADKATATEKKQRNYIIFLTDGQANGPGDTMTSIPPVVEELVTAHGVAVYAIMISKAVKKDGIDSEKLMQSIALPTTGKVAADHVGTYVHAEDPTAIDKAFADFFKKVTTCE